MRGAERALLWNARGAQPRGEPKRNGRGVNQGGRGAEGIESRGGSRRRGEHGESAKKFAGEPLQEAAALSGGFCYLRNLPHPRLTPPPAQVLLSLFGDDTASRQDRGRTILVPPQAEPISEARLRRASRAFRCAPRPRAPALSYALPEMLCPSQNAATRLRCSDFVGSAGAWPFSHFFQNTHAGRAYTLAFKTKPLLGRSLYAHRVGQNPAHTGNILPHLNNIRRQLRLFG